MKKRIKTGILFLYILCFPVIALAAGDSRFFGTYCGSYEEKRGLRTYEFTVKATSDYRETSSGNGLVIGHGMVRGEGKNIPFVFSGAVTGRGNVRGSGILGSMEPTFSSASLSDDGNAITIRGMDRTLILKKDRCGNEAPGITIQKPRAGNYPWGDIISFSANVTDREDASFPDSRLVWSSDRDGRLGNGRSIFKNSLSPGRHKISFSATDSGGRISKADVTITVQNNRPNTPVIEEPSAGPYYEGLGITFRARANDREDGNLTGRLLVWSSSRAGRLGTGSPMIHELAAGEHTITLTATDRAGLSSAVTKRINVRTRPAGNAPPSVTITSPVNYYAMGDNESCVFVVQSSDLEDGRLSGRSLSWKDRYVYRGAEVVRNLGTGESINVSNLPAPVADTRHVITVTATDSGGLTSTNSIVIYVIPGGLI